MALSRVCAIMDSRQRMYILAFEKPPDSLLFFACAEPHRCPAASPAHSVLAWTFLRWLRKTRRPPSRKKPHCCAMAQGWNPRKPRSRVLNAVRLEAATEKKRRGRVGTTGVLGAAKRSSLRAKGPKEMEIVQTTLQAVDVTTQNRLADWVNRENPVDVLRDEIDPQYGRAYALQTAALRADADLDQYTARVEESSAGVAANVVSRRTRAAQRAAQGYKKTTTRRVITSASTGYVTRKITRTMTPEQLQAERVRHAALEALPPQLRPTFDSQTAAPGNNPGIKSRATGRARSVRLHPETKRSQAEVSAQARRVTGPAPRGGSCKMKIPKSLFSGRALARMGFRPVKKPKREFIFTGPTARADAEAFDDEMMKWLKDPNRDGPPPQPRKP